jgi:iron complex outermembrane receptor protein
MYVDDIPSTLADGQSGVDDVDLGSATRIEVIRGPSSALYGSSSGGVISMYTEDGPETPFVEAGLSFGEYDQQKYQFKTGGQHERINYLFNASHLTMDGYRDNSEVEHTLLNSKIRFDIDDSSSLTMIINAADSPTANDPGGVTTANIAADRRQAQPRNLSSNSGEEFDQQKLGFVYKKSFGEKHDLTLRNYYLWRDFQTFLPIGTHIPFVADDGVVEFDRFFYGGGAKYSYTDTLFGRPNRFTVGFDVDIQEDDRQRFLNNAGVKGALSFDQLEEAEAFGIYFRNELSILDNLQFTLGGRYDTLDMSVNDRFLANADQSSELSFNEFNPTVGLSWEPVENVHLYTNYASSFETPTFTELANPARDGSFNVDLGGFNNVSAQTADSFEIGMKLTTFDNVYIDVAAYTMQVDDEISNVSTTGSRGVFTNADTDRKGLEISLVADLFEGLQLTTAYTYSDFEFDQVASNPALEGNNLPGLPEHQFYTELAYHHNSGFYAIWDLLYIDDFFANNANTTVNSSSIVANIRAGYQANVGNWRISPYLGINNMFDEKYNSNVRINGFGGRLFEPAPDLNLYGGITLRYSM